MPRKLFQNEKFILVLFKSAVDGHFVRSHCIWVRAFVPGSLRTTILGSCSTSMNEIHDQNSSQQQVWTRANGKKVGKIQRQTSIEWSIEQSDFGQAYGRAPVPLRAKFIVECELRLDVVVVVVAVAKATVLSAWLRVHSKVLSTRGITDDLMKLFSFSTKNF